MGNVCWLPCCEYFDKYGEDWLKYQDILYEIFKNDFIESRPLFGEKPVHIRKHPIEHGKEEAFFHVTCQEYLKDGERFPDFRRCERIRWVRSFIENYNCNSENCINCDGIKVWEDDAPKGTYKRVHLLLEKERYMVVIERRENYNLLITAFYFEHDHTLAKKIQKYKKTINPLK